MCCRTAAVSAQEDIAGSSAANAEALPEAIRRARLSVVAISRTRLDAVPRSRLSVLGGAYPESMNFLGTGVVVGSGGSVVTCAHVLGDPRQYAYRAWVPDPGSPGKLVGVAAQVQASDVFSDLAVLAINVPGLQPVVLGEASELVLGQSVVALGDPDAIARFGMAGISRGVVVDLKRFAPKPPGGRTSQQRTIHTFGTMIQSRAREPVTASGGALLDEAGKLVGLTTSLVAAEGAADAAGFSIAVDSLFVRVVETLSQGRLPEYGYLGIQPDDLGGASVAQGQAGALVRAVLSGMPGAEAGLRADDVIVRVGDQPITSASDLFRELSRAGANRVVLLSVERLGQPGRSRLVRAQLGKMPLTSPRMSFAVHAPTAWRGMAVDYLTALPQEQILGGSLGRLQGRPVVAVTDVQPQTPAWDAGIRPGDGIASVQGFSVATPEAFRELVASASEAVSMVIVHASGAEQGVAVQSSAQVNSP